MQFGSLEATNQPLAGVPNAEELGQPEPVAAAFEKEADPLRALFGEYIVQCSVRVSEMML